MLWQRALTAVFGIPIIFFIFYLAGWPLMVTSMVVITLGLFEFYRLAQGMDLNPLAGWGYAIGLICVLFGIYLRQGHYFPYALWLVLMLALTYFLFSFPRWTMSDLIVTYFGGLYIGGLFSYLIKLREIEPEGWAWVILVFLLTWANDTAAYFVGSQFGKLPLCSKLSPKKTIEGFIGGMIFTILTAITFGHFMPLGSYFIWGILGCLAAIVGTLGDLWVSALKRLAQAKDSGALIPGHGGMLDRLDSLLLVAPLVYYYIKMVGL